jgi:hypothetical protein
MEYVFLLPERNVKILHGHLKTSTTKQRILMRKMYLFLLAIALIAAPAGAQRRMQQAVKNQAVLHTSGHQVKSKSSQAARIANQAFTATLSSLQVTGNEFGKGSTQMTTVAVSADVENIYVSNDVLPAGVSLYYEQTVFPAGSGTYLYFGGLANLNGPAQVLIYVSDHNDTEFEFTVTLNPPPAAGFTITANPNQVLATAGSSAPVYASGNVGKPGLYFRRILGHVITKWCFHVAINN